MDNVIKLPPRTVRGTLNRARWEVKFVPHTKKYTWYVEIPRDPLTMASSADTEEEARNAAQAFIRAYQSGKR